MARRSFFKKRSHRIGRGFKRFARKGGVGRSTQLFQIDAMAYGAARGYVAPMLTGLVGGILPLGAYSDEIAMGVLNYFVAKNTSGMLRDVAVKGLVVENARVGETLIGGMGMQTTQSSNILLG